MKLSLKIINKNKLGSLFMFILYKLNFKRKIFRIIMYGEKTKNVEVTIAYERGKFSKKLLRSVTLTT